MSGERVEWIRRRRRRHGGRDGRDRRLPGWATGLIVLLLGVLGLLVLDGVYVALTLRSRLTSASGHLENARGRFDTERLQEVEDELSDALIATGEARGLIGHPAFRIARHLPFLGNDAGAVASLAEASDLAARAGLSGVRALQAASEGEARSLAASIYSDGVVNFRAIEEIDPKVREAARLLAEADRVLQDAPEADIDQVVAALEEARSEVSQASDSATKGVALLDGLPGLLGKGGTKEYFLAFQSPSEIRGTGGFPGVYGVLTASDGHLSMGKVGSIATLDPAEGRVTAPGWYQDLYRDTGALVDPRQAGYSPNFPVVSQVWLGMYERTTGQRLDGVVAMDPVALADLTRGTGPISAPGLDVQVGPDNAVETLLYDSYVEFDDAAAQEVYLARLVGAFWDRLGSGDVDAQAFASGLADSSNSGHFKAYATTPTDQDALVRLGTSGDYAEYGNNVQLIYANNAAANKIDFFMHRTIETDVTLVDDGSALVRTRLTLENRAPADAPRSLVFGPGIEGDEAGLNAMILYALLPQGSQLRSFTIDGKRSPALQGREGDYPVAYDIVEVPAGESATVVITYRMSEAWDQNDRVFDFVLYPQAVVTADRYELKVESPGDSPFDGTGTPSFSSSGDMSEPVSIRLRLEE